MEHIERILLTKFSKYAPEREIRAFLSRDEEIDGRYYARFRNGVYIQEVILGRECDVSEDHVRSLVASYPRQPILVTKLG